MIFMEVMSKLSNFFSNVTADGWISFIGSLIGALVTAISVVAAILQGRRQMKQQKVDALIPYCEALVQSLPSYDKLMTQADYLDENDNLLGSFTSSEEKLHILKKSLETVGENDRGLLAHKVKMQKEYLDYWKKANEKIEKFMSDGYFNIVKSACPGNIIICYYDFVVAFHNEHFYCGPVIDTALLKTKLTRLLDAINEAKKV